MEYTDNVFKRIEKEFEELREIFSDDEGSFRYAKYANMQKLRDMRKKNGNSKMIDLVEHMLFLSQDINQFLKFHKIMMSNLRTTEEFQKIVQKIYDPCFKQLKVNSAKLNSHLKGRKRENMLLDWVNERKKNQTL